MNPRVLLLCFSSVVGSMNWSQNGLDKNIELVMIHRQGSELDSVDAFFEDVWDASEPFQLEVVIQVARQRPGLRRLTDEE